LRDRFVAQSSMAVFVISGWAVVAHYIEERIRWWHFKEFLLWSVLNLASIGLFYVLVHFHKRLEESIHSFVDRLVVLSFVYVSVDSLSVIVVTLRNAWRGF